MGRSCHSEKSEHKSFWSSGHEKTTDTGEKRPFEPGKTQDSLESLELIQVDSFLEQNYLIG